MATLLRRHSYEPTADTQQADLVIVNTCGFIEAAREEAELVLRELIDARKPHQRIVAAGCYAQYRASELAQAVPGLDGIIGTRAWQDIVALLERLDTTRGHTGEAIYHTPNTPVTPVSETDDIRRVAVQGASAYLKIAEGCQRHCAFCAIPLIKGPSRSRPLHAIVEDAVWLADQGIQEIIVIAQDITAYGRDLVEQKAGLVQLVEALVAAVPQVPWLRLMYAYPDRVMDPLAETMARYRQVLPYVDLPLQHAHPDVLRRMRRPARVDDMRQLVGRLRDLMPEVAIRTTFLVGYPGETEDEFSALLEFVEEIEFDRLGVFTYSHEEGTLAGGLPDDVPPEIKERRREQLMAIQQPISLAHNQDLVGHVVDVLVEGHGEGLSVGRSYRDAPEIDGLVLIEGHLPVGEILPVKIETALEYDLIGVPA